jgi:hypothetical protein
LTHRVPNGHGGLHILIFFSISQFSSASNQVHSPSVHTSSSSHGGSQIKGLNRACCRKQTPNFLSHNPQSGVHGLSIEKSFSIRMNHNYPSHLQIGGNGYHSDGTIQKARLAPIIS